MSCVRIQPSALLGWTLCLTLAGCAAQMASSDSEKQGADLGTRDRCGDFNIEWQGTIQSGETLSDGAYVNDRVTSSYKQYVAWSFNAEAGETVLLHAQGRDQQDFDTVLQVFRASDRGYGMPIGERVAFRDDWWDDTTDQISRSSKIEFKAPYTGTYTVIVSSYRCATRGYVQLTMIRSWGNPCLQSPDVCTQARAQLAAQLTADGWVTDPSEITVRGIWPQYWGDSCLECGTAGEICGFSDYYGSRVVMTVDQNAALAGQEFEIHFGRSREPRFCTPTAVGPVLTTPSTTIEPHVERALLSAGLDPVLDAADFLRGIDEELAGKGFVSCGNDSYSLGETYLFGTGQHIILHRYENHMVSRATIVSFANGAWQLTDVSLFPPEAYRIEQNSVRRLPQVRQANLSDETLALLNALQAVGAAEGIASYDAFEVALLPSPEAGAAVLGFAACN